MKRLILIFMAMAAFMPFVSAESFPWLVIKFTDGTTRRFASEGLSMVFRDDVLRIDGPGSEASLKTSSLASMYFATEAGVVSAVAEEEPVEFYTLTGVKAGVYSSEAVGRTMLPAGIYIVKQGSSARKVMVR